MQCKTGVERIEKLINKIIKSYSIHTVLLKIHSIVIEKSLSEGFFSGDRKKYYRFRDIHVQGKYSKHNFNQKSLKHKYVKKRENNGMRTVEERGGGDRIDSYLHLRERERQIRVATSFP